REMQHDDRVLAAREQQARGLHLGRDLAEDVDALVLERAHVTEDRGRHSSLPAVERSSWTRPASCSWSPGRHTRRSGSQGSGRLYASGLPSSRVVTSPAARATATGAAESHSYCPPPCR